jgi:hypothetical protein
MVNESQKDEAATTPCNTLLKLLTAWFNGDTERAEEGGETERVME